MCVYVYTYVWVISPKKLERRPIKKKINKNWGVGVAGRFVKGHIGCERGKEARAQREL